jgi:polar amino acid transport system substrate-binding protein
MGTNRFFRLKGFEKCSLAASACGAVLLAASISSAWGADLDTSKAVVVALANEPPYTELKPDGTMTGIGPDLDREVLRQAGFKEFTGQTMSYGAMIPAVLANRVTMVSSVSLLVRPERCAQVIFSEPTLCNSDAFMVRGVDEGKYNSYKSAAAASIKLAVGAGTVQERDALKAGVQRVNLVAYPDATSAVKLLQDKRVDAIALNGDALKELQKRSGDETLKIVAPLTDAPVQCAAAAFNKNETALRDAYNVGLKNLIASGEYATLMAKYGLEDNVKLLASAKPTSDLCTQQ